MDEIIPNFKMSKTAYEIETELRGSGANRTGFGGRPELINFYAEMKDGAIDVSSMPVLDSLTIDALRCGKIIPVCTMLNSNTGAGVTTIAYVMVSNSDVRFILSIGESKLNVSYTIATKTWAVGA